MIVADTFRRDHLGAYGNSTIRTPYLDRLAASSIVFDQHRISSFPTMPARADFLTGRFSFTFMGWEPLPPALDTLPAMLSRAGYLTMGVADTPSFIRDGYCGKVTMVDRWIGMLLNKLEVLGIADNTIVVFTSDHGHYFGEHEYFGKADWIHDPDAVLSADADVPTWFSKSWLLTIGWSPLYQELYRVPFLLRVPGVKPGRRQALTTAPDIPATILDLAGVKQPDQVQGRSVRNALADQSAEHRPFVVSSWPLYFAKGELTSAVDSRKRLIASHMPVTVSNRRRSLIMGGPSEPPELYDLEIDPQESANVWAKHPREGAELFRDGIDFLRSLGTAEKFLQPREESLKRFAAAPASPARE